MGFAGSFSPQIRCENLEIHKVFRRFRNKFATKNFSPNLLAELCGIAIKKNKNKKKPKTNIDYAEKLIDFALGILEGAVLLVLAKYIK